jgi:predicted acetyltransferase
MEVDLVPVSEDDKDVLANLIQFYRYDFAASRGYELTRHGTFVYPYLDCYFIEPEREPYFIFHDGELAGFALARADVDGPGSWYVCEFFVVRHHRRRGVAQEAARLLFARHPGFWALKFDRSDEPAAAFWPHVVGTFARGPVTEQDLQPPEVTFAATRLRFEV